MTPEFYTTMEKDIEEWEKKYPGRIYSPEVERRHKEWQKQNKQ